jgi:hypothetical protein
MAAAPPVDPMGSVVRPLVRRETLTIIVLLSGSIVTFGLWLSVLLLWAPSWWANLEVLLAVSASGWLVGLLLLWTSRRWRANDKLIGTLLLPGGLLIALGLFAKQFLAFSTSGVGCSRQLSPPGPTVCTAIPRHSHTDGSPLTLVVLALAVLIPIVSAMRLNRRRRVPAS